MDHGLTVFHAIDFGGGRVDFQSLTVSMLTLQVSDHVEGAVIGDDVEIKRDGGVSAIDGEIQDMVVFRHIVVFSEHSHGLFIDLGIVFGAVADFGIAEGGVFVVLEDGLDLLEELLWEEGEGRWQILRHFVIIDLAASNSISIHN